MHWLPCLHCSGWLVGAQPCLLHRDAAKRWRCAHARQTSPRPNCFFFDSTKPNQTKGCSIKRHKKSSTTALHRHHRHAISAWRQQRASKAVCGASRACGRARRWGMRLQRKTPVRQASSKPVRADCWPLSCTDSGREIPNSLRRCSRYIEALADEPSCSRREELRRHHNTTIWTGKAAPPTGIWPKALVTPALFLCPLRVASGADV